MFYRVHIVSYVPKVTTIQLEKSVLEDLRKAKRFKRQTYSELLSEMLKVYKSRRNQYDEFLHRIQQERMTDLWDNKPDEKWDNV